MKKKIISLIVIITSLICVIGVSVYALIADAINEKHNTSLAPNQLLVKGDDESEPWDEYYVFSEDRSFSIKNYENGFNLIAVTADSSEGKLLYEYNPATYDIESDELSFEDGYCVCNIDHTIFDNAKTYYIMAVNYTKYDKFVTSYEDLALLNSEYRHSVINDDLRIGNVTDFYNSIGDYIGNETFDISNGVYDFYGNIIPKITNGVNTYTLPYNSPLPIELNEYHRADFYTKSGNNYVLAGDSINITPATTATGLYDKYGRIIKQIYVYNNNRTFDNYVFTSTGVLFNGKTLDANKTIDLTKSYFENGILVDDAYDSDIFRNIYVLNDIRVKEKLDLIMPCNIHLINNDIIVSNEMNLKHYYTMNYVIDGKALGTDSAGTFKTESGTGTAISIKTPNANANITITKTNVDDSDIDDKTGMLTDVLDFAQSYFVDYILVDKYYQVPSHPKKIVSYDYIDIFQGLYEMNEDGDLEAIERVTDDNEIQYTIEYDGDSYREGVSTYLPISVTIGDSNNYTWYIKYNTNGAIDYIYRRAGSGETKDDTITIDGDPVDIIKFGNEISYIIDRSSEAEYYTLFLTNPVLPTSFYNENVTIKYYFADESWNSTGETFHVYKEDDNQQRHVLIVVSDGETTQTARVNSWLMGSAPQAVLETVALKLEVDINRGFASETTTSVLINYDTIEDIYGNYAIEFTDTGHATYREVDLEVPSDPAGDTHKFIKVTRNSFSLTDGFGELVADIDGESVDPVTIFVQLRKISESYYDEMIKNEIGQVFFNQDHNEYDLPNETDLTKYNVKEIDYEVRVSYDGGVTTQPFSGITFEKDGTRYYLDKGNTSNANNFDLYLKVYLTLNDDYTHQLMTNKILFAQGTTGGEGENSYIENVFEEDFALISNFIGLSNPFKVDDANIRFYMEMDNNDNYSFVDIYVKYIISPEANNTTIASINGDRSGTIPAGTYTYLDEYLNRGTITIPLKSAGDSIPSDGGSIIKELYTPLTSETLLTSTTNIVFLTDASQIGKTDTPITVYTYLTDTGLQTGAQIKASYDSFAHYDLFDGLYNSVGSKIKEITDGNITYVINYTGDNVTSVVRTEGGVTQTFTSSHEIDLSGFYYNNFIGRLASVGTQVNLARGIYSENVNWTPITSFVSGDVTYTITYDENGEVTSITGVDAQSGDPVDNYTVTITSADLAGDRKIYTRNSAQQTIFYEKTGEDEYSAITMYKQIYSFNVPGIYKTTDFNVTNQYDLYTKIKENYEDELFDEINGSNQYLLAKTVEEAERLVIDLTSEQPSTTISATKFGYFKKLKYLEIRYAVFDGGKYSEFITQTGVKDGVDLKYIHNTLETLILDHCKTNQGDKSFANFKQLTKLVYTNNYFSSNVLANVVPTLYRRLTYLDLSNNNFSDISRLNTLINLEYLDLRNNAIKTFDKLAYDAKGEKAITTLNTLYIGNNTVNTTITLGSTTIKPYGTPSYNNDGTINNGAVNVATLIQILDNNPELKIANDGTNDFENENLNSYRKSAYVLNAIMYMNRYDDNLSLDITPILNVCTVNGVYMTVATQATYSTISATSSPSYSGNGYYTTALTADANYEIIISITYTDTDSNSFTIYREIYFKEGTLTTS
ncbi:MAG: leucine-rich repeat domain-containing protein [Acholeplasmatales bacterium]|nr:leucine-rich repeat domain-containing protein [Acholeplasmatales bacterium]